MKKNSILFVLMIFLTSKSNAVFNDYIDTDIIIQGQGSVSRGTPPFLDGNTTNGTVTLSPRTDRDEKTGVEYSGTHWRVEIHPDSSNFYSLRCLGKIQNPQYRFLDGNTFNGNVRLSPHRGRVGGTWYSGTRWQPQLLPDGTYALECKGHHQNQSHKYLSQEGDTVRLVRSTANLNTHWFLSLFEVRTPYPSLPTTRFPTACELNETELRRCLTACQSTKSSQLIPGARSLWTSPMVRTFGGQTGTHGNVLNRHYQDFGIFIAEGSRVIIAFPGTDFLKPSDVFSDIYAQDWNIQRNSEAKDGRFDMRFKHHRLGGTGENIPGRCHKGFLGVYKSTSGDVRKLVDDYWQEAGLQGPEELHITFTGHSLGGAVATLASADIVNHLYFNGNFETSLFNARNNVTLVTFGAPPLFNQTATELWNQNWGQHNHLRVFRESDPIPTIYPQLIGWRTLPTVVGKVIEAVASNSWKWVGTALRFGSKIFKQVRQEAVNYKVFQTGTARSFEAGGKTGIAAHTLDGYAEDFDKWAPSR